MRRAWIAAAVAGAAALYAWAAVTGAARREVPDRTVTWVRTPPGGPPTGTSGVLLRVLGPDGEPVPRGWYRMTASRPGGGGHSVSGDFADEALWARRDGREFAALRVEFLRPSDRRGRPLPFGGVVVEDAQPVAGILEVVLPPERILEGKVLDPAGAPVEGATVRAFPPPERDPVFVPGDGAGDFAAESVTGEDGSFRLDRLGTGPWLLRTDLPGDLPPIDDRTVAAADGAVVLRSGADSPPTVTAVDPDGTPIPGVRVRAEREGPAGAGLPSSPRGGSAEGRTDAAGRAFLRGLDPEAAYGLAVEPETAGTFTSARLGSWRPRNERVVLERLRQVRVRAVDPAGNPLVLQQITWRRDDGTGEGGASDREGFYAPAAPIRVWGWVEGSVDLHPAGREVLLGPEENEARLVLDPGASVTLRIADPPAGEFPSLQLATEFHGGGFRAPRAEGGAFRWCGLRPGEACTALVLAPGAGLCALETGLSAGGPERTVRLVPGRTIAGRVHWPPGREGGVVWLERDGRGFSCTGRVDEDGAFTLECLPPGEWIVVATTHVGGARVDARAVAGEDGAPLEIRFP